MIGNRQTELSSLVCDNVDEILVRIIQFTHIHHSVITENIRNCRAAGFVPRCIDVEDFAKVISAALAEHQKNKRLALCDSKTVSFLPGGNFALDAQVDSQAAKLAAMDFESFIELQKNRLRENTLNNKAACALLNYKRSREEIIKNQATDSQIGNQV